MNEREKFMEWLKSLIKDMQEEVDEWRGYTDDELRSGLTVSCDWYYLTLEKLKIVLDILKAQEPCEDAVSREQLIKALNKACEGMHEKKNYFRERAYHEVAFIVEKLPSVQPVPDKYGRWVTKQRRTHYPECKPYEADYCSICGKRGSIEYSYCPNCGAKMDNPTDAQREAASWGK